MATAAFIEEVDNLFDSLSMVEIVLNERKNHVAQSVITVPISLEEGKCGDRYDYFGYIILFSTELINMYIFQFFKIHYIPSVIFYCGLLFSSVLNVKTTSMFQDHGVCHSSAIILLFFIYH
jgi:hypothetical protein